MKEIVLDEYFDFERPKGYTPSAFLKTEDEIRDLCDKNQIIVGDITRFEGYRVVGKKIKSKKQYLQAKEMIK